MKKIIIILGIILILVLGGVFGVYAVRGNLLNSSSMSPSSLITNGGFAKEDIFSNISMEEYYEEELRLDESEENVLLEEPEAPNEEKPEPSVKPGSNQTPKPSKPSKPYYIKVNRQANCVTVYTYDESGAYTVPVKAMVCSVGLNGGTPTGVFKTSTKYLWRALYGNVFGQYAYRINGPILFHSVPYYTQNKGDLKSEEYNKLGQAASMGCVRLSVKDAKWLIDNCPQGTTVEIYDSPDPGPLGKPSPVKIDLASPYKGWDPTDPDPTNPWKNVNPTITGVADKTIERGQSIDLLANVCATDYAGNTVTVNINGSVDVKTCGSYVITYVATDANGRTVSQKATISVVDTIKPIISASRDITVDDTDATQLQSEILSALIATDGTESLPNSRINLNINSLENAMKQKAYGTYTCSATVSDMAGNPSEELLFTVSYIDTPPVITLPETLQPINITADLSTSADSIVSQAKQEALTLITSLATAVDSKDGALSPSFNITSVSKDANGLPVSVTLSIQAQDTAGNISTKECTVTILVTVTPEPDSSGENNITL